MFKNEINELREVLLMNDYDEVVTKLLNMSKNMSYDYDVREGCEFFSEKMRLELIHESVEEYIEILREGK